MRIAFDEQERHRRPVNPDQRERPVPQRGQPPDPLGIWLARMPVDEACEEIDRRIDGGRGLLREAAARLRRWVPTKPLSPDTGGR